MRKLVATCDLCGEPVQVREGTGGCVTQFSFDAKGKDGEKLHFEAALVSTREIGKAKQVIDVCEKCFARHHSEHKLL